MVYRKVSRSRDYVLQSVAAATIATLLITVKTAVCGESALPVLYGFIDTTHFRYFVVDYNSNILPRLVQCVDWTDRHEVAEVSK